MRDAFLFLSFIAKGLEIFRLGGVITTQKVHFYKLKLNCIKHFWVVVRSFYPNWHVKDLVNVTNQFLVSFSVFGSFFLSLKQAKIEGEFCASYDKTSWRSITWRIRVFEYFKTINSKMEENRAFRKAKSSIWQGVPKFGKACQNLARRAKIWQGVRKSLCVRRPSGFFSRIVIFPFYSFCNK